MNINLDQHITGGRFHRWTDTFYCPNGHRWEVTGWTEYGCSELDADSPSACPECGEEGEFL